MFVFKNEKEIDEFELSGSTYEPVGDIFHHVSRLEDFLCILSNLSKRLSDLKHNGTQEKALFSGTVLNTLSPGVIGFIASFSSKNYF